jgi:cytosine/adenosine deaminase-related metal-dependent hydrolase
VRVFAGNDNIRDCWWPYGNGDLLQRAMLLGYRSGFYTDADLMLALDMVTTHAAQVIGCRSTVSPKAGRRRSWPCVPTMARPPWPGAGGAPRGG